MTERRLYRSRPFNTALLYAGFAATGVGVALPGALLPALLARWRLPDEGGGRLFLMAWIGSSMGALLVVGSLRRALCLGALTIALSSLGLNFCSGPAAPFCMLLYGLGLGASMTAISLIRQAQTHNSGRELVRLNLLWAIGASTCPVLVVHSLKTGDLRSILYPLALLLLTLAAFSIAQLEAQPQARSAAAPIQKASLNFTLPLALVALVMLTTGVEASAGGWLATYAKRGGDPLAQIVAAPTCLWAGLLVSRLFWSFYSNAASERRILQGSILLMAAASTLLLLSSHGLPLLMAAACLGFGIGPAYPLLLAWSLRIEPGGLIFCLAGLGSASMPWLMGFVSTRSASLHVGFAIPALATAVMVVLSFVLPASVTNPTHQLASNATLPHSAA